MLSKSAAADPNNSGATTRSDTPPPSASITDPCAHTAYPDPVSASQFSNAPVRSDRRAVGGDRTSGAHTARRWPPGGAYAAAVHRSTLGSVTVRLVGSADEHRTQRLDTPRRSGPYPWKVMVGARHQTTRLEAGARGATASVDQSRDNFAQSGQILPGLAVRFFLLQGRPANDRAENGQLRTGRAR